VVKRHVERMLDRDHSGQEHLVGHRAIMPGPIHDVRQNYV